jgi:hypothetical protein
LNVGLVERLLTGHGSRNLGAPEHCHLLNFGNFHYKSIPETNRIPFLGPAIGPFRYRAGIGAAPNAFSLAPARVLVGEGGRLTGVEHTKVRQLAVQLSVFGWVGRRGQRGALTSWRIGELAECSLKGCPTRF